MVAASQTQLEQEFGERIRATQKQFRESAGLPEPSAQPNAQPNGQPNALPNSAAGQTVQPKSGAANKSVKPKKPAPSGSKNPRRPQRGK